ncbi:S8 family peptidase [Ectopseudomonas guguanensis]|uniref:S8 family peptidase n=1 Tax=Ectopseudomonas guguanensis TaxID=1198456 RepID=UPI0028AD529E|nr:S8 family peptidase [Pseudomonas guguanensis]
MTERPLLWFPQPQDASRTKLAPPVNNLHKPTHQKQGERVGVKLTQLQEAFEARRAEVLQTAAGVDPEQVLVIETAGTVDDFSKAVKKIDGLEWLGEIEVENLPPDEDFFNTESPEKSLNGRLYLVLTNQQALTELLSLWQRYKDQDDEKLKFDRGLTKFRDVFCQLLDIRRWGLQDRLIETGVLDVWQEELNDPELQDRPIRFEAELWYRDSDSRRAASERTVTDLIEQLQGQVISSSVVSGIQYHAILAELPANKIQEIISTPETELVKCDNIMFFRPIGQISSGEEPAEDYSEPLQMDRVLPATTLPVLAILDGMPLANHSLLESRLIIDDPDGWAEDYPAVERIHGTTMASLAIHGDLNCGLGPLQSPIYIRPIMRPDERDFRSPRRESIPTDILPVDLIHRAVKRILEGDGEEAAAAPTVRIINLSIGDYSRQFSQNMSPLARLLDWLSSKYGILFIISAGNQTSPIPLETTLDNLEQLSPDELESLTVRSILINARSRSILSPAESINGICVGSIHFDGDSNTFVGNRFDPYTMPLPSPVSSFGSGYRRSIKPDLVLPGGKILYDKPYVGSQQVSLLPSSTLRAPGNKVAIPGNQGALDSTGYTRGTSNSTALASRAAVQCHTTLMDILSSSSIDGYLDSYTAPLLKAMLVHGCSWGETGERLTQVISTLEHVTAPASFASRWLGYGVPDIQKVLECTAQRATVLGYGQLLDGQAHLFRLPLPPSLSSVREWRRLTITLAWISPVQPSNQKYRCASMWFEANNQIANQRQEASSGRSGWQAVKRGTLQHEIFEGQSAHPFVDGDSLVIKVNCRKEAAAIDSPVPYGIAVSFEVGEGVQLPIYEEIRQRVRIQPAIQVQQSPRA